MTVKTTTTTLAPRPTLLRRLWQYIARDILIRGMGFHLLAKIESYGLENLPKDGPTIVIFNHTSTAEPLAIMGLFKNRFVMALSKVENFRIPFVGMLIRGWGATSVNRGQVDRNAIQATLDILAQGNAIMIAPEGTRQPIMIKAKDGMAYIATKANAVIVPIGFEGTRIFAKNLKRLHRTHITVRVGRPFRFRTNGRSTIPRPELGKMTQEAMYQIAALVPESLRGYYADSSQATTDTLEFM